MPYVDDLDPAAPASLANTMPTGGTWNGPLSQQPLTQRLRRTSMPTLDTGISSRTMFLRGVAQRNAAANATHQKLVDDTAAFNQWYGGLAPEEKAKFTPADTTSSLVGRTDNGLTLDMGHNPEGLTRQAAWNHFQTQQKALQTQGVPLAAPAGPTLTGAPIAAPAPLGKVGPAAQPTLPLSLQPTPGRVTTRVPDGNGGWITTVTGSATPAATRPAPAGRSPSQVAADEAKAKADLALAAERAARSGPGGTATRPAPTVPATKPAPTTKPVNPDAFAAGELALYNADTHNERMGAADDIQNGRAPRHVQTPDEWRAARAKARAATQPATPQTAPPSTQTAPPDVPRGTTAPNAAPAIPPATAPATAPAPAQPSTQPAPAPQAAPNAAPNRAPMMSAQNPAPAPVAAAVKTAGQPQAGYHVNGQPVQPPPLPPGAFQRRFNPQSGQWEFATADGTPVPANGVRTVAEIGANLPFRGRQ